MYGKLVLINTFTSFPHYPYDQVPVSRGSLRLSGRGDRQRPRLYSLPCCSMSQFTFITGIWFMLNIAFGVGVIIGTLEVSNKQGWLILFLQAPLTLWAAYTFYTFLPHTQCVL